MARIVVVYATYLDDGATLTTGSEYQTPLLKKDNIYYVIVEDEAYSIDSIPLEELDRAYNARDLVSHKLVMVHRPLQFEAMSFARGSDESLGLFQRQQEKKRKICAVCNKSKEAIQRCSVCKDTYYCSRECQLADWRQHKKRAKIKSFSSALASYKLRRYSNKPTNSYKTNMYAVRICIFFDKNHEKASLSDGQQYEALERIYAIHFKDSVLLVDEDDVCFEREVNKTAMLQKDDRWYIPSRTLAFSNEPTIGNVDNRFFSESPDASYVFWSTTEDRDDTDHIDQINLLTEMENVNMLYTAVDIKRPEENFTELLFSGERYDVVHAHSILQTKESCVGEKCDGFCHAEDIKALARFKPLTETEALERASRAIEGSGDDLAENLRRCLDDTKRQYWQIKLSYWRRDKNPRVYIIFYESHALIDRLVKELSGKVSKINATKGIDNDKEVQLEIGDEPISHSHAKYMCNTRLRCVANIKCAVKRMPRTERIEGFLSVAETLDSDEALIIKTVEFFKSEVKNEFE